MTNRDEYSPLVDITETSKAPLDKVIKLNIYTYI